MDSHTIVLPHEIKELIIDMARAKFLSRAGSLDAADVNCKTEIVTSWQQAYELRGSDSSADAFDEGRAMLTRRLSSDYRKAFRQWNDVAEQNSITMEAEVFPVVDASIDRIEELRNMAVEREFIKSIVRRDLLMYASEQTYSRFVEPGFYTLIFDVYSQGRFPCGWDLQFPGGKIWMY